MRKPNSIKAAFIRFIPWWIIKTFKSFLETYFSHHCSSPHICIHLWNHRFEPSYLAARAKERQRSFTPQCQRYHLMKSTFILEHLVCLVRTASAGRCRAVRAKPQVGTWKKKKKKKKSINSPMDEKQWNLTINPAVCSAETCLACWMQWEWMNCSTVNLSYDSRGEIDLNGDWSWSH